MVRIEQRLHLFIQDNPSVQEARDRIPGLIEQFDQRCRVDSAALGAARCLEKAEEEEYV
jgi:hypothetical protein